MVSAHSKKEECELPVVTYIQVQWNTFTELTRVPFLFLSEMLKSICEGHEEIVYLPRN